jgi:hypothetical protein
VNVYRRELSSALHLIAVNFSGYLKQVCCSFSISVSAESRLSLSLSHSKRSRTFIYIIYLYQREGTYYNNNNCSVHADYDECMHAEVWGQVHSQSGHLATGSACIRSLRRTSRMQVEWARQGNYLSLERMCNFSWLALALVSHYLWMCISWKFDT